MICLFWWTVFFLKNCLFRWTVFNFYVIWWTKCLPTKCFFSKWIFTKYIFINYLCICDQISRCLPKMAFGLTILWPNVERPSTVSFEQMSFGGKTWNHLEGILDSSKGCISTKENEPRPNIFLPTAKTNLESGSSFVILFRPKSHPDIRFSHRQEIKLCPYSQNWFLNFLRSVFWMGALLIEWRGLIKVNLFS